jgi:hypothetical protein
MRSLMTDVLHNRYGSDLEKYIVSKDPKTLADVEQFTLEYHRKLAQQVFN